MHYPTKAILRVALLGLSVVIVGCRGPNDETNYDTDSDPSRVEQRLEPSVPVDSDDDGYPDNMDNCPWTYNPDQLDCDGDGLGSACDNESIGQALGTLPCGTCDLQPPTSTPRFSPFLFYAVGSGDGDGSSDVYEFRYCNYAIRNFRKIGEAGIVLWDIALDRYTGILYGMDKNGYLRKISAANGSTSVVGYTGGNLNALTGTNVGLFGWSETSSALVQIDTVTGAATTVGYTGFYSSGDLAASFSGKYYGTALNGGTNALVKMQSNGAATLIGSTGVDKAYGVAIDQQQVIFMARASASTLYLYYINPQTGASTQLASYPTSAGMSGLTTYAVAW